MNLVLLSFHPALLVSAAEPSTVVFPALTCNLYRKSETKRKNTLPLRSANTPSVFLFRAKLILSFFSVRKTSKVTSYYLLARLIVANEIPNALIEQVCNLLPNEVVFSHRQTKTK